MDTRYPLAWAAVAALAQPPGRSRRCGYRVPSLSELPRQPLERETSKMHVNELGHMIASGVDPLFDQLAVTMLGKVAAGELSVVVVSSLSRLSREVGKMLRMIEFILGHGAAVLTTNYLLRPGETFQRGGDLVPPDSSDLHAALGELSGLGGVHRKLVETIVLS